MVATVHCKKSFAVFRSPAGMSLTKLSLDGNNFFLFPYRKRLVSDIPAGSGKTANLFLQCIALVVKSSYCTVKTRETASVNYRAPTWLDFYGLSDDV
jgi:hypothetical protein